MITHYDWAGGREAMLRFGPVDGPIVIVSPPLFEEANRTRRLIVEMLRLLAARGIGGALPDLPGTGDSVVATDAVAALGEWRGAYAAAAASLGATVYTAAIRGGALIDGDAATGARWRLSPLDGRTLVREIRHARVMAAALDGHKLRLAPFERGAGMFPVAGNRVRHDLLVDLVEATIAPGRTVRLDREGGRCDRVLAGVGPWRRNEPEGDPVLAQSLADDIAGWIATCGS